jgi:hypothetical protein
MIQVAILRRRLREGKTYEDFRKAWYHTVGFDTANRMLTVINVADPREIIVIGLNEIRDMEQVHKLIAIDREERGANPLDGVIEPEIERTFGLLVADDDFSPAGKLDYKPPMVNGKVVNMDEVSRTLEEGTKVLAEWMDMNGKKEERPGHP